MLRCKSMVVMLGLLPMVVLACTATSPTQGQWFPGESFAINVMEFYRVPEVRFQGGDQAYYVLRPKEEGSELVLLHMIVSNQVANKAFLTVDEDSAELRGFENDKYFPIDVSARIVLQEGEPSIDERLAPFVIIWGPSELDKGLGLNGWVVFEAPKDTPFRQLKWIAGDTIFIDF